ncbi:MAG: nucleotidyltransferase substrate binding protein [Spirochaetales bacterium]
MESDVRWLQRLENFEKAVGTLGKVLDKPELDVYQRAGLIQFFEMSFELGWNVLKDYLEHQGIADVGTPRAAVKKAFEVGLIADGRQWLKGLEDRNLTSHTYNEAVADRVVDLVRDSYFPLFQELLNTMAAKKA